MKYGYCRVSTRGQLEGNSIEDQIQQIKDRYFDAETIIESYSGAKERAEFNNLFDKLLEGDILVVTKLDRFCRTTKEGLQNIEMINALSHNGYLIKQQSTSDKKSYNFSLPKRGNVF